MIKYSNLVRISSSFLGSAAIGRPMVWGLPFSIGLELTNHCNLRCLHCASGAGISKRDKGFMSKDLFLKIREELADTLFSTVLYFQGESMMHPGFFEILKLAEGMNPQISTNGHFLDSDSCVKLALIHKGEIIVSLDGLSEESYAAYRKGGDFQKVKKGIENLAEEIKQKRSRARLVLQVLVNSYNEHELRDIKDFASGLNARLRLKSMQLIDNDDQAGFLPGNKKFRRYSIKDGKLQRKGSIKGACFRLWTNPVISWDGKVLPCCFDKDAEYIMGDLNSQSFREIWNSESYRAFRTDILHNRAGIEICRNCTEGLPVWIRR